VDTERHAFAEMTHITTSVELSGDDKVASRTRGGGNRASFK